MFQPLPAGGRAPVFDTMWEAQRAEPRRNKKMPDCQWKPKCELGPSKKPAPGVRKVDGLMYCAAHGKKKEEQIKIEKEKVIEAQKLKERQAEMAEMAKAAEKKRLAEEAKKAKIQEIKAQWNAQVQAVVQQVQQLRHNNPGVPNINAGNNPVGNTPGGSNNPLQLNLAGDTKGAVKGDIFPLMKGFDGSDSAGIKIRIEDPHGNILVHVH
jgi:uncharacterized Zn finger protein (UPF0148 family)